MPTSGIPFGDSDRLNAAAEAEARFFGKRELTENFPPFRKSDLFPGFHWVSGVMAPLFLLALGLLLAGTQAEINFGHQKCGDPNCQSECGGFNSADYSYYTSN